MLTPRRFISVLLVACASFAILPTPASANFEGPDPYEPVIVNLASFPTLSIGSTRPEVESAALMLSNLHYGNYRTAVFDSKLRDLVKFFQGAHGLAADGVIGQNTWKALMKDVSLAYSPRSNFSALASTSVPTTTAFGGWYTKHNCTRWEWSELDGFRGKIFAHGGVNPWGGDKGDDGLCLSDGTKITASLTILYEDAKNFGVRKGHVYGVWMEGNRGSRALTFMRLP